MQDTRCAGAAENWAKCGFLLAILMLGACDSADFKPGEERLLSVTVDDQNRIFTLYIPDRYDKSQGSPLLFAFHGTPGNGPGMRKSTHLDEIADRQGWLISYPDGLNGEWAAGCLCSGVDRAGINDVEFITRMIARIQSEYIVDTNRIYSVGFSSGGIMNYRISCNLNEIFAATASIASSMTWAQAETCTPSKPTPVLAMIGTEDESFPWSGTGMVAGQRMPIDSTFSFWGRINQCDHQADVDYSQPKDNGLPVRREQFPGCAAQSEVVLYAIEGGTHVWPATANAALVAFFERHTLLR